AEAQDTWLQAQLRRTGLLHPIALDGERYRWSCRIEKLNCVRVSLWSDNHYGTVPLSRVAKFLATESNWTAALRINDPARWDRLQRFLDILVTSDTVYASKR